MPAEGIHLTALREATAAPALSPAIRRALTRWDDAARLGAVALDLAYFDHYAEEVARYALRIPPRHSPWGDLIHERAAIEILRELTTRARAAPSVSPRSPSASLRTWRWIVSCTR